MRYTYLGGRHESVPRDVTDVIFHPSVNIIQRAAFYDCRSLERVTIPDTITRIGNVAFRDCVSLRFLRLSTNLEYIGHRAFRGCSSLEAVFLPPTVTSIGNMAFSNCKSLRFCILPDPIEYVGDYVFSRCNRILTTIQYENGNGYGINNAEVNERLMQRHANLPFHQACFSTSVTSQEIEGCIQEHGIECATEVD